MSDISGSPFILSAVDSEHPSLGALHRYAGVNGLLFLRGQACCTTWLLRGLWALVVARRTKAALVSAPARESGAAPNLQLGLQRHPLHRQNMHIRM